MNTSKRQFHVRGMHCNACTLLVEDELLKFPNIKSVKADLKHHLVEVEGDFGAKTGNEIIQELSGHLKPHGYLLALEKQIHTVKWSDFKIALPIAIGFGIIFVVLQKLGLVNLITSGEIGYGTAFAVGLIASVSTCMAVVGGLALSISANFAKEGDKVKPQALFHAGRVISFFILGGATGAIGAAFQLGAIGSFVLSLLVGLIMLLLGINLLDVFHWAKKLQPTLPKFISKHTLQIRNVNHTLTPFLIGAVTFFLPCGFTQSMQIYALSTGNFLTGALVMLSFALGTLPVLGLLSFTSVGIHDRAKSGIFFKTAGLVVILLALFNIINSFVGIGLLPPIFNF